MTKEHDAFANVMPNECVNSKSHGFAPSQGLLQPPGEHGLNHSHEESHEHAVFEVPPAQTMSKVSEMLGIKPWAEIPVGCVPGSFQDQSWALEPSGRPELEAGTRVMDEKARMTSPQKVRTKFESQGSRVNQSK